MKVVNVSKAWIKSIGGEHRKNLSDFFRSRWSNNLDKNCSRGKNDFVHNFGLGNRYPTDPAKRDVQNGMASLDTSKRIVSPDKLLSQRKLRVHEQKT